MNDIEVSRGTASATHHPTARPAATTTHQASAVDGAHPHRVDEAAPESDEHESREREQAGPDRRIPTVAHPWDHQQRVDREGDSQGGDADEDGPDVAHPAQTVGVLPGARAQGVHCGSRPERASTCSKAEAPGPTGTEGPNRPGVPPSSKPPTNAMHAPAVASSQS